VEAVQTQVLQVDTAAPLSTVACNGTSCLSGWYTASVTVALSASDDAGGSGVAAIRYTTDGSDPTSSSPTYIAPFSVSQTTIVKYRAWDNAGNTEGTDTQSILVDTTAPSASISCNGSSCSSGWYTATVQASLSASDIGSGVAVIRYTTNGSDPTTSSATYAGAFSVSQTTTVKYRAWDNAGNVGSMSAQTIRIDGVPPTVAITSPANSTTVNGTVKITATAGDVGSGIAGVRFYVDGQLLGTATAAPYRVVWNSRKNGTGRHVLTAVAVDVAGNSTTSASVTVTVA
jgi:Bacterial Ig domain/Chitobiase/beta-hexosaminidase C-terminal domain